MYNCALVQRLEFHKLFIVLRTFSKGGSFFKKENRFENGISKTPSRFQKCPKSKRGRKLEGKYIKNEKKDFILVKVSRKESVGGREPQVFKIFSKY